MCPTLRNFFACEGLIGCRVFDTYVLLAHPRALDMHCRVFDTYVLLAHPRALDLHYRTCADVVPLARRVRVDCRVPHTAQLRCL